MRTGLVRRGSCVVKFSEGAEEDANPGFCRGRATVPCFPKIILTCRVIRQSYSMSVQPHSGELEILALLTQRGQLEGWKSEEKRYISLAGGPDILQVLRLLR